MRYEFTLAPPDPKSLAPYLNDQLFKIGQALNLPREELFLQPLGAAPQKPRAGQLVFADGTNWDPGSGDGPYCFDGTNWIFLG